jgi:hypothetical protein
LACCRSRSLGASPSVTAAACPASSGSCCVPRTPRAMTGLRQARRMPARDIRAPGAQDPGLRPSPRDSMASRARRGRCDCIVVPRHHSVIRLPQQAHGHLHPGGMGPARAAHTGRRHRRGRQHRPEPAGKDIRLLHFARSRGHMITEPRKRNTGAESRECRPPRSALIRTAPSGASRSDRTTADMRGR